MTFLVSITPAHGLSGCCSSFLFIQFPGATPFAIWGRLAKNVMYEHFFNSFGLRENPFHVSPDPRFYFPTRAQESALAELLFGVETRQGLMVLTGEAGTGKTTLLNQLLDWLQRRGRSSAYVFHALLEPVELLQFILRDFCVSCSSNHKGDVVDALYTWLRARNAAGDLPALILDEAQALPQETLDELRLLLNLETPRGKLLQIVLSGQPELDEKLRLPALRQLRQRIMFHSRISLLTQQETATYIARRLAMAGCPDSTLFPPEVVQAIYASSHGIPRVVNLLCQHALISANADQQHVVSREMIQRIAVDFDLLNEPLNVRDPPGKSQLASVVPLPVVETFESPSADLQTSSPDRDPVPAIPSPLLVTPPKAVPSADLQTSSPDRDPVPAILSPLLVTPPKAVPSADLQTSSPDRDPVPAILSPLLVTPPKAVVPSADVSSAGSYWRSVSDSFVRDCRLFFHTLTRR